MIPNLELWPSFGKSNVNGVVSKPNPHQPLARFDGFAVFDQPTRISWELPVVGLHPMKVNSHRFEDESHWIWGSQ